MPVRHRNKLVAAIWIAICLLSPFAISAFALSETSSPGSVPFILEDNRIFAELTFVRVDGTPRKAYAFVDLGTPSLILNESLSSELRFDQTHPLVFRVGETEVTVNSRAVMKDAGSFFTGPDGKKTVPVEAVLPGSILKNYQVVFDYAAHTLTLASAITVKPEGIAVPCRVNEKTGLISVDAFVDGHSYPIAIDSGSAYTWIRDDVAHQWLKTHPDWTRGKGAVGESNMQSRPDGAEAAATILRVPEITLGPLHLEQIGALGIAPPAPPFPPAPGEAPVRGNFFDWYSKKTPEPVIGWLGGNVLKAFRLTIDFPNHMTYWQHQTNLDKHDLDQVGITLETRDNEKGYFIAGISEQHGKPAVDGLRVGDKLTQIDSLRVADATRGGIFSALHGKPGATRTLILERNGQPITLLVKVTAF
jgi:hypothetical protein